MGDDTHQKWTSTSTELETQLNADVIPDFNVHFCSLLGIKLYFGRDREQKTMKYPPENVARNPIVPLRSFWSFRTIVISHLLIVYPILVMQNTAPTSLVKPNLIIKLDTRAYTYVL